MTGRPIHPHHHQHQDPQSRVFYELSSLVLSLLRSSPIPISFTDDQVVLSSPNSSSSRVSSSVRRAAPEKITAAGFASLMLGISMALMLCGSVTFIIGFMLMPWVIGLVVVLYFVGLVTAISMLARAVVCQISSLASSRTFQSENSYDGKAVFKANYKPLSCILGGAL